VLGHRQQLGRAGRRVRHGDPRGAAPPRALLPGGGEGRAGVARRRWRLCTPRWRDGAGELTRGSCWVLRSGSLQFGAGGGHGRQLFGRRRRSGRARMLAAVRVIDRCVGRRPPGSRPPALGDAAGAAALCKRSLALHCRRPAGPAGANSKETEQASDWAGRCAPGGAARSSRPGERGKSAKRERSDGVARRLTSYLSNAAECLSRRRIRR